MNNNDDLSKRIDEEILRRSREWMWKDHIRRVSNFKKLNGIVKKNGIAFLGDSITDSFPVDELIRAELSTYNRGISGFTVKQMKDQLDDLVFELEPQVIFLLIGTNDIAFGESISDIISNIESVCAQIVVRLPNTSIYLQSLYPVDETMEGSDIRTNQDIDYINGNIMRYTERYQNITYIDVNSKLRIGNKLNSEYTYDGLHLNMDGYVKVAEILNGYLK